MTLTWADWIGLAAGSGVMAGIANQLLSWLRDHMERAFERNQYRAEIDHQSVMLLDQRRHEALMRAERAHYDARPALLLRARNVHAWLFSQWGKLYGGDLSYSARVAAPVAVRDPGEVLGELEEVAIAHPTWQVRQLARRLDSSIDQRYNFGRSGDEHPSQDEIEAWIRAANELIEAIHEFPGDESNIFLVEAMNAQATSLVDDSGGQNTDPTRRLNKSAEGPGRDGHTA